MVLFSCGQEAVQPDKNIDLSAKTDKKTFV